MPNDYAKEPELTDEDVAGEDGTPNWRPIVAYPRFNDNGLIVDENCKFKLSKKAARERKKDYGWSWQHCGGEGWRAPDDKMKRYQYMTAHQQEGFREKGQPKHCNQCKALIPLDFLPDDWREDSFWYIGGTSYRPEKGEKPPTPPDYAKLLAEPVLAITEGQSDADAVVEYFGIPAITHCYATNGPTPEQAERLNKLEGEIWIFGDRDPELVRGRFPGLKAISETLKGLKFKNGKKRCPNATVKIFLPPEGVKDIREWLEDSDFLPLDTAMEASERATVDGLERVAADGFSEYRKKAEQKAKREAMKESMGEGSVDVTNHADAAKWLKRNIGLGKLSGMMMRTGEIVYTPRVGEDGYIPLVNSETDSPEEERAHDGPAQVRIVTPNSLAARIDFTYNVVEEDKDEVKPALFPLDAATRVLHAPDMMTEVRRLSGVVHTPIVRPDGSILSEPGYDAATGMLYLPDPDLASMISLTRPMTSKQLNSAKKGLNLLTREFEFGSADYKINYLGALLTPLLRAITPPPYKMFALDAPVKGTGKTTAANVIRYIHGGVFRSEMPENAAELRKQLTSILDVTTAPVVIIDNVTGMLRSSVLAGLLTSDQWDDRELGKHRYIQAKNDRLWTITGNNVQPGGDMPRRIFWSRLDSNHPQPWKRTFENDILSLVKERRSGFVWCLLTLVRAWVEEGMELEPINTAYGQWTNTVNAILQTAGYDGEFDSPKSIRHERDPQEDEWYIFISAIHDKFGTRPWTAKHVLELVEGGEIQREALPGSLMKDAGKVLRVTDLTRTLGNWLKNRLDVWATGEESDPPFILRKLDGEKDSLTRLQLWRIELGTLPA